MPVDNEEQQEVFICDGCSYTTHDLDELCSVGDSQVCESCRTWCERCEEYTWASDSSYIEGVGDYCDYCRSNYATWCEGCENYYNSDSEDFNYINDCNEYRCESCIRDYFYCHACDEWFDTECGECGAGTTDDCVTMPRNMQENTRRSPFIKPYSYKPEPVFYGEDKHNLFFGIELEMEIRSRNLRDSATLVMSNTLGKCYMKEDSSIGQGGHPGFELVTHPMSFAHWQDNMGSLWETLENLRTQYEARSWDASSCGLHIHASRDGFKSGAHTHRWLTLIYKNAPYMMRFAGRKTHYARFNDIYKENEWGIPQFSVMDKIKCPHRTDRYSAVNTMNEHTLELRFFRGTMKPSGVLSALELTHASIEYTRDLSLSDVKLGMLGWDWFYSYVESNNGRYPNLYERMSKVAQLDITSKVEINA